MINWSVAGAAHELSSWTDVYNSVNSLWTMFVPRRIYEPGMKLIGVKTGYGRKKARRDAEWSAAQRREIEPEEILAFRKLPLKIQHRTVDRMMIQCFWAENRHSIRAVGGRVLWNSFMRELNREYFAFLRTHSRTMGLPMAMNEFMYRVELPRYLKHIQCRVTLRSEILKTKSNPSLMRWTES